MSSPGAPLWPAGHLPRKGGDRLSPLPSPISGIAGRALSATPPISPLAGEMAGRPEGGAS
ncbi:lytic murein transglycosylase [Mesorhizobium sp. B2-8-1]|nr:lytic murein transglycosylase [Mesorhizobium sp. B2-8-1]TPK59762.1 lytic murein transglycosylase [Mesorhizobium sp. B2-5-1]TPM66743.1 lytic murein transglycosylase [Mesorhizobium sp. B2-1-9]TPM88953.1 lytic murein transglycosylase [Mesorhizobium sp. B2-1-4]TPN09046.1 lytic murein transglycosylase [Mesorhizobium sp. B2-1-2]